MPRLRFVATMLGCGLIGAGCLCVCVNRTPTAPPAHPGTDVLDEARSVVRELGLISLAAFDANDPERAGYAYEAALWIVPRLTLAAKLDWPNESLRGYVGWHEEKRRPLTLPDIDACVETLSLCDLNAEALKERAAWPEVVQAIRRGHRPPGSMTEWPWIRQGRVRLLRTISTASLEMDFTDSSLYDIIDFIQEFAKINIVISVEVRREEIPERKVDFVASSEVLERTLRRLCDLYGLTWRIEGAILVVVKK